MASIDLSEAVNKAAAPFKSVAVSGGKRLSTSIATGVRTHADAAAVAQVVELLLDNAMRYASEDSVIELSLCAVSHGKGKGAAELVVSNAVDELPEGGPIVRSLLSRRRVAQLQDRWLGRGSVRGACHRRGPWRHRFCLRQRQPDHLYRPLLKPAKKDRFILAGFIWGNIRRRGHGRCEHMHLYLLKYRHRYSAPEWKGDGHAVRDRRRGFPGCYVQP